MRESKRKTRRKREREERKREREKERKREREKERKRKRKRKGRGKPIEKTSTEKLYCRSATSGAWRIIIRIIEYHFGIKIEDMRNQLQQQITTNDQKKYLLLSVSEKIITINIFDPQTVKFLFIWYLPYPSSSLPPLAPP